MDKYQIEAEKLSKAIDIAIEAITKYTPKEYSKNTIENFLKYNLLRKELALNPEKKFRRIVSLNYLLNSTLTLFQEDTGEHVEYFWNKIRENNLGYKRVNVLEKILKRSRISNINEYDIVVDTIVAAQQEGRITEQEAQKLGTLLTNYQNKRKAEK